MKYKYLKNEIKDIFWYNPRIGISNFFKWMKTIYNDRDYDYCYIYDILIKKLELQEKSVIKYCKYEKPCNNEIRYAIDLLKKIKNDNYTDEKLNLHHQKWGKIGFDFIVAKDVLNEDGKEMYELIRTYEKPLTDEEKSQEREEYHKIIMDSEKEKKEDIKKVFNYIGEKIENWWF